MRKIFSFDAETDGLWGQPFAVAAIVYELQPQTDLWQLVAVNGVVSNFDPPVRAASFEEATRVGGRIAYHRMQRIEADRWVETYRFMGMLPLDGIQNEFVLKNVVPALSGVTPTHQSYEGILRDFTAFYLANKQDATVICHVGSPVEMHRLGFIGDWDAPFPLIDISGNLDQMGEDPTSVDSYAQKYGLEISDYGTTHNPLYDCEVAAKVYIHLKSRK